MLRLVAGFDWPPSDAAPLPELTRPIEIRQGRGIGYPGAEPRRNGQQKRGQPPRNAGPELVGGHGSILVVLKMSSKAARRTALAAQGFAQARPVGAVTRRHLQALLTRTQLLQLDSVNVAVRAHYAPVFSRLGNYPVALLEEAAWSHSRPSAAAAGGVLGA